MPDLPETGRVAAAELMMQRIKGWRESLPAQLGSIRPSLLIPAYKRQTTVIKLAHCHAIMHATRSFILGGPPSGPCDVKDTLASECIMAARIVLKTVEQLAHDGPIFHAFWWTHYVTFCALIVVYVWEISHRKSSLGLHEERIEILNLAGRCHSILGEATATNSPSRSYAAILDDFRQAATSELPPLALPRLAHSEGGILSQVYEPPSAANLTGTQDGEGGVVIAGTGDATYGIGFSLDPNSLDWKMTDWLDLDSSVSLSSISPHFYLIAMMNAHFYLLQAFWPHADFDGELFS